MPKLNEYFLIINYNDGEKEHEQSFILKAKSGKEAYSACLKIIKSKYCVENLYIKALNKLN